MESIKRVSRNIHMDIIEWLRGKVIQVHFFSFFVILGKLNI